MRVSEKRREGKGVAELALLTREVPLDTTRAKETRLLALEVLEDLVGVGAVYVRLCHDVEGDCWRDE